MEVTIRRATLEDVPLFIEWVKNLGWVNSVDTLYIQALVKNFHVLVAVLKDEVVGVIMWCALTDTLAMMTELMVKEGHRGDGIGSKLLVEGRPDWLQGKNIWIHAVHASLDFYPWYGFGITSKKEFCFMQGRPRTYAGISPALKLGGSEPGTLQISDGNGDLIEEFLDYEKGVIKMSTELENMMRDTAKSGNVIIAKDAGHIKGVAITRSVHEIPGTDLCNVVLFADDVKTAIEMVKNISGKLSESQELLMSVPQLNNHNQAIAEYFGLNIDVYGKPMFTLAEYCDSDICIDKVYSFIPI